MVIAAQKAPDYTMLSRKWSGEKLVTAETAIALARGVHSNVYGQIDLDANEPLMAEAIDDVWIVRGGKKVKSDPTEPRLDGPLVMQISQFDAQILSYYFELEGHGSATPKSTT